MKVMITDAETFAASAAAKQGIEVSGPDGTVIGRFVPNAEVEFPESNRTLEEMDRLVNDPKAQWVGGDEVMARLRTLRNHA